MIASINIENIRGIKSGRLEGLAPLTILTGPNGSGKSTILDALLIATNPAPEDAVGRAVQRHPVTPGGARWLLYSLDASAELTVTTDSGDEWRRTLKWYEHCDEKLAAELHQRMARLPFSMVSLQENQYSDDAISSWTVISSDNQFIGTRSGGLGLTKIRFVRLVDPGIPIPLHRTFTEIHKAGLRDEVYGLLAELVPGFEQLLILVEDGDHPALHISNAGTSVPVPLSGDGIQAFVQLALESAIAAGGLVLLEEPEVYQHPKAIWQTAKVLLANLRRDVQTVLTTHSLELIDALLSEATKDDLEKIALFNVRLAQGNLEHSRRSGKEMEFSRQTLENDLR